VDAKRGWSEKRWWKRRKEAEAKNGDPSAGCAASTGRRFFSRGKNPFPNCEISHLHIEISSRLKRICECTDGAALAMQVGMNS